MILKFIKNLLRAASTIPMLIFWFLGLLVVVQIIFNVLWLPSPLKWILLALWIALYLTLVPFLVKLVNDFFQAEVKTRQASAIVLSVADAVIAYTKDFEIVLINAAAEKILGFSRQEVIGKVISPELSSDPKFGMLVQIIYPSLAPFVSNRQTEGHTQKMEMKFFKPEEIILEVGTTQITDDEGKQYGFLKILRDKTREGSLDRTKSDFITVAAHQMRTPLAGLLWAIEMLYKQEAGPLNEEQKSIVKQALLASQEMSQSLEGLLSASQIEQGKFGYNFEPADVEQLVESVLTEFQPAAEVKKVKLYFYRPETKLEQVVMDRNKIKLVLETLVDNAIKYNVANGEVKIKIEVMLDRPYLKFSISDTGNGINHDDLEKLFTKFFRSEKVMKEQTSGLGLGLYIARNIIKRHGGEVSADSTEGRGSVFEFTLPTDSAYIPPANTQSEGIL